ncbi:hypothetical protein V6N12_059029 [Hibiscus sabdariffa]|uniref:Uncharacterized protein n=1 Tax=Hibiscus sabdariffa TaxID=183260 RepID=A0ABR2ETV1_9ROSI
MEENEGSEWPLSVNIDCFKGLEVVPTTQVRESDDVLVEGTAVDMLKKVKCIYDYDDEEARTALEVGIRIIGNEEDVIEDIMQEDMRKLNR